MFTLKEFADQILKPSVLRAIKSGSVDGVLCDPDVLETLVDDKELSAAAIEQIKITADQS